MNATELFLKDGRTSGIFYCEKCRIVHKTKDFADQCCQNYKCDKCGADTGSRCWTACDACRYKHECEVEDARFEKAEKIPSDKYDGWVFFEGLRHNDGFAENVDALLENLEYEKEDEERTFEVKYVWACNEVHFALLDVDYILQNIEENGYEGFDVDMLHGTDELKSAIDKFNEANKNVCSYEPDYKKAIILKEVA